MADLNFPLNPNVGDTYSIGSRTWIWNGTAWQLQSAIQNLDPFTVKTLVVTSATNSTSTNTGAAIVEGGVGIGGNLYVGSDATVDKDLYVNGILYAVGTITTASNLAGGFPGSIPYQTSEGVTSFSNDFTFTNGILYVPSEIYENDVRVLTNVTPQAGTGINIDSLTTSNGNVSFVVNNTGVLSLTGTTYLGVNNSTGDITLTNLGVTDLSGSTYIGVSANTGSITISNLGVLSLTNGTDTVVTSSTGSNIAINVTSDLQSVTSRGATTNQSIRITSLESSNTFTNGALVVDGGVGIGENLNVGGTLNVQSIATFAGPVTFSGTATYVFSTNTVYTDNLLELHTTSTGATGHWTFDDGKDIGLRFHYFNRNLNTGTSAALVLSNDEQMLEFYGVGAETESGNFSEQTGASYGGFRTGQIFALSTTNSTTSTNSGALQVSGGASIVRDLWVGGNIYRGGNLVITQDQLATATVTAIQAGPGISVTTSSGIVTISNTGTLQSVTDNGSVTTNAITITNTTQSSSTTSGALLVTGGAGIGGNLNVGGNIVGASSFIESSSVAGTNSTSNWWLRILSFTLPNIGDSTTFKVRTNAKVLNNTTFSDNSDSDYAYITYVKTSASAVLGSIFIGQENSTPANSFSTANYNLTFNSTTGYFELWRRSTIAGGRVYTRIEETLPTGIQPIIDTTTTWVSSPPQQGTTATTAATNPGTFGTLLANAITITGTASLGSNSTGATVNISNGGSTATKFVNIATGGLAGSTGTVTIGSSVAGALERLTVNTTITQFTSTAQSSSTSTGAVQVAGGVGIGGNLYVGGPTTNIASIVSLTNTSAATSVATGALRVSGGVGVSGSLWANQLRQTNVNVAIGSNAGASTQSSRSIAIGVDAGRYSQGGVVGSSVAIGDSAGTFNQQTHSVAIGEVAAYQNQGTYAVAIGYQAGQTNQQSSAVAIGSSAAQVDQQYGAVAIGTEAAFAGQGENSVAIGNSAGWNRANTGTIILNATGNPLDSLTTSSFYVAPIRADASTSATTWTLFYNPTSKEITTASISPYAGVFRITNTTSATSTSTGALVVAGGVGIGGDLWIGGILYSGGQAVLTTSSFASNINAGPDIQITTTGTSTIVISNISTLQSVTGRGSTTTNAIRISNSTPSTTTQTGALTILGGLGVGGAVNASNLNSVGLSTLADVTVNGTLISNSTISLIGPGTGTTIAQFATGATASGNTKTVNIGTGGASGSITNINIGNTASTSTIVLNGNVQITKTVADPSATSVNTSPVVLDSFSINEYRSAKYFISISNTATNQYQTSEIWLVQDGEFASIEQTSVFSSGTNYVVMFSTDITAGVVSLIGTGINTNNRVKVQSTYITV